MAPVLAAEKATWAPAEGEPLLDPLRAMFEPIMAADRPDLRRHRLPGRVWSSGSGRRRDRRAGLPETGRARTDRGTRQVPLRIRASHRSWCAPSCATTNPTGSTRSSCPPASRRGASAATTSTCTRSSSASPTSGSPTPTAGSPRHTTTRRRSTLDGWEIQRRCPHLKADLSKFGVVDGTTLTCNLHGWQWDLETGRCLTSKGHELRSNRL